MNKTSKGMMKILLIILCIISCLSGKAQVATTQKLPETVKVMTYNVLGRKYAIKKRIPVLLDIIAENEPDIIAMQEVTSWFIALMANEPWFNHYHNTFRKKGKNKIAHFGLGILSKYPISNIELHQIPTKQKRHLLSVTLVIETELFKVITFHLDSLLFLGDVRKEQLKKIWEISEDDKNVLALGDFNFGDNELPETLFLSTEFKDLWLQLHEGKPGYTWNREESKMAKKGSFKEEKSRRLDRILLKSTNYKPAVIKIIGNKPLNAKKTIFPSDHFGLSAIIKRIK